MVVPRVKKFHSKVRSGCITCKKRKVKCDEDKPFCRRCLTSARQCEGYFVSESKAFQAEADSYDAISNRFSPDIPVLQIAFNDATAIRSFEFFVENAIPTFCAYFGRGFWARTFPQASFDHPILKHILVATAALIEKLEYDTDRTLADEVYKQHYNKALLLASSPSFASQLDTILMACLMFACCAFLQCSVHTGYQHILSGMKIIAEQYSTKPNSPDSTRGEGDEFVLSSIAPLFASYAMKAPTYGYPLIWPENFPDVSGSVDPACVSATFRSINHARHCLDGIAHCLFREQYFPEEDMHEHVSSEEILRMLKKWDHTTAMYLGSLRPSEVAKIRESSLLLRAHRVVIQIMVELRSLSIFSPDQLEQFTPQFQRINQYMRSVLHSAQVIHNYSDPATYFTSTGQLSSHLGFIPPLYFTAVTCNHLPTRLEALRILKALCVIERAWTSCIASAIVENVLILEYGASVLNKSAEKSKQGRSIKVKEVTNKSGTSNSCSQTAVFEYDTIQLVDKEFLVGENEQHLPWITVKSSLDLPMCGCVGSTLFPLEKILRSYGYQGSTVPQPTNCSAGVANTQVSCNGNEVE